MQWLVPAEVPVWAAIVLIVTACLTSAITAALGIGGGVLLLAVLSMLLPAAAVIPLHGLVQLGSNANRAAFTVKHIRWRVLYWFAPGVVLGALLASVLLIELPPSLLQLSIAGFILLLCWGPAIPKIVTGPVGTFFAAIATTFLSHFVGATGPLVASFIKQQQQGQRQATVATFAAVMTLQHAPKVLVYSAAGFVFQEWLGLALAMIVAGVLGTKLGLNVLQKTSDQRFAQVFNVLLTLLALRLIWQALSSGSG
ncbi:sulfite exporter TauE/SafE family protein [Pseudomonas sp. C27(2019)]|uniref:sulfite exporter TauE/SafE family protein n=1 Tax=Pseudomonas sp. C27(2019) TaxID=2604941 RepID=UPI001C498482|nr:sulfite exporter TauE/SafE family protein [Pseudomonas sp. C27(2019)]